MINVYKDTVLKKIEQASGTTFSPEQVEVIQRVGKPMSVIASAGAGKTTTMIAKLFYMEQVQHIKPYEMLTISFTNKAVRDIESRYKQIRRQLKLSNYSPDFSTFHAFFKKLLMQYPQYEEATLLTGSEYKYALMKHIKDTHASANTKSETIDAILNFRGYLINMGKSIDGLTNALEEYNRRILEFSFVDYAKVIEEYNQLKEDNNELDFDDLQAQTLHILKDDAQNKLMLETFKSTYKKVVIDEFQDISPIQSEIMNILVNTIGDYNLITVGDDDQCQPAGTQVLMQGGTIKNIEDIQPGDRVVSYLKGDRFNLSLDGHTGLGYEVLATSSHYEQGLLTVTTEDGKTSQYTKGHITYARYINSDSGEPFELRARDLVENEMELLIKLDDNTLTYSKLVSVDYDDTFYGKVYSLEVDEHHNYVADNIVTHNCIYRFRGSDPQYIIDFPYNHLNADQLYLSTNYRCPQDILSFVAPFIEQNTNRVYKTLQVAQEGGQVDFIDTQETYDEFIEQIRADYQQTTSKEDLAILVRDNALRMLIGDMLLRRGIPVDIQNMSWSVYNSGVYKMLTDIVYTIKRSDNQGFVNKSWVYAPHLKKAFVKQYEDSQKMWVEEIINGRLQIGEEREAIVKAILHEEDAYKVIKLAYSLVEDHYISGSRRGFYNIDTVRETYDYILQIAHGHTFHGFIEANKEVKQQMGYYIQREKVVNIYTMHGVKGLEFKNVYIYNPIDRYLLRAQYKGQEITQETIEEERRLFYVAVTRAKERVVLVYNHNERATFIRECLQQYGEKVKVYEPEDEVESIEDTVTSESNDKIMIDLGLDLPYNLGVQETKKRPQYKSDTQINKESAWEELKTKYEDTVERKSSRRKMTLLDIDKLLD